ncbi:MAG: aspartate--tRNA(Asn) ligase [Minisyncoccia bacterium]
MERTLIVDLKSKLEQEVFIQGSVNVARNQGKVAFFDFRDRSGIVQGVVFGKPELLEVAKQLRGECVVSIIGLVHARPEKMVNAGVQNGDIELEITQIEIVSMAEALPFDLESELNLDTLLDYRPLTLRRAHERAIFKVQHTIITAYRTFLVSQGFTEFQAPKLVGGDAEGGAEVFKVDYFNDQKACLATSPQLYKQMMVGVFERVFTTGNMFRAEKSATTRHLSEISMLDFEMGFIKDHTDVIAMATKLTRAIVDAVAKDCAAELALLKMPIPLAPESFPTMTLREAQQLILKETGVDKTKEPDLEPEDERFLCEYANKNLGSDFVFVTHFPTKKRPFYTHVEPESPEFTRSFDMLFRGLEMCSGSQRVHNYETLIERIKEKGLDPEKFHFYLQAFKHGIPPHGGIGLGLERLTAKFCGVGNIKEATLFPRDINRIDTLLTKPTDNAN